ncbi:MAG: tyrosine-protein phosphatase [Oscillochloridaceae bacterium umkhey_bin13]
MIDLHSHILHEIDDGSRSLAEAVELARAAVSEGVRIMAATPHGKSSLGGHNYSVETLRERMLALRAALAEANIPLKLVAGTEIMAEPGALERLQAGELSGYIGSKAVLIEFPLAVARTSAEQLIFTFQLAGRRVVLAHPERYQFVRDDPNTLIPLIERGVLMQLTGDALLGRQGERMRQSAEQLLSHGLIQILASDSHGPHYGRMPNLGAARKRAAELVGETTAALLTEQIPAAVLSDGPIEPPEPQPIQPRRRRFWSW